MRTQLVELPSGGIDLEMVEGELRLQFNSSCEDALPYCQAMCCRMKQEYGPEIGVHEKLHEMGLVRVIHGDTFTVPVKTDNPDLCLFLDRGNRCSAQSIKPEHCRDWHCSPKGQGEGLTIRASGWRLTPTQR